MPDLGPNGAAWDLSAKEPAANPVVLRGQEAVYYEVLGVGISPDNNWLVTGCNDRTARSRTQRIRFAGGQLCHANSLGTLVPSRSRNCG